MPFTVDDILTLETDEEATFEEEIASLQRAINSRIAWDMQGSMGRAMMDALRSGYCILPEQDYYRAYGLGHIPNRYQVQDGTLGSESYARNKQPDFWSGRDTDWAEENQ